MSKGSPFLKVPVVELTTPRTGTFMVHVDYWWSVTEDDCLLFYSPGKRRRYSSPQCNANRTIAEKVSQSLGYPEPTELRQIPVVFAPLDMGDY